MDWIPDFQKKFSKYEEIQHLKRDKFDGSVTTHFQGGIPQKYKLELWRTGITFTKYGESNPNEREAK